ncbi:unnamed protein product [Brassica rapa]|uniref:Potassium channel domain-containing protein n=1 Tax=Brassica campestris TaxID=3711 RepID=A0A3P5Z321_BRACM|nr:unnamed protein product [Brassica rapa]VDC74456.1 unnamed protein product [Brassica rapa]
MADDRSGGNSNNTDPLLQYMISPRFKKPPPILFPLPENDKVSIPMPLTPSEFKDRLIFGPSSRSPRDYSSQYLDSQSPSSSSSAAATAAGDTFSDSSTLAPLLLPPPPRPDPLFHGHALHRSKTAPAMSVINDLHLPVPHQKDLASPSSRSVVRQAFALLLVYLSLGVLIYSLNRDHYVVDQTHPVVDGLYFCIVTMCTIGYGDITPNSVVTKLFSIMFVLVGFGFIDILLSGMVSYVLDLQESY